MRELYLITIGDLVVQSEHNLKKALEVFEQLKKLYYKEQLPSKEPKIWKLSKEI